MLITKINIKVHITESAKAEFSGGYQASAGMTLYFNPIFPIVRFSMQMIYCHDKDFCIQYLIDDSIGKTAQLTSAGVATEWMPCFWKMFDSLNGV
jgi:hypothetical protein